MSAESKPRKTGFPEGIEIDTGLACDADLNTTWSNAGPDIKTPRERLTIREALLAQTRAEDASDRLPQSDN